jgi:hypothetical protein
VALPVLPDGERIFGVYLKVPAKIILSRAGLVLSTLTAINPRINRSFGSKMISICTSFSSGQIQRVLKIKEGTRIGQLQNDPMQEYNSIRHIIINVQMISLPREASARLSRTRPTKGIIT